MLGLDGLISDCNEAAATLYDLDELDIVGRELACGALAGLLADGLWVLESALLHGSWQTTVETPSSERHAVKAAPLADDDGRPAGVVVAFFALSEPPPASEPETDPLRATIDSLSARVAVVDERGDVVLVNQAWREFGQSNGASADYVGVNYLELCTRSGDERALQAGQELRELLSGERESIELEYPCTSPADERWFVIRAMPYVRDGRRSAIVIHLDITERRRVRQTALLQAALLDEVDVAVIATDMDHRIISWNAGAERLYGWSSHEAVGSRPDELVLSPDTSIDPAIGARLAGGQWDGECVSRRKDGSTFPAYFRISTVRDDEGRDSAVVWVSLDISERRRSEQHLQLARDYLRTVIDSMGQGMYTLDAEGRLTYMNQPAQDLLGYSLEDLIGAEFHHLAHSRRPDGTAFPSHECPILRSRRSGELVRVDDDMFVRADGTELPVAYTASPFSIGDGVEGTVVVFQDISERRAEARRIERDLEKLASIKRIRNALSDDGFVLLAQPIIELASGQVVQRELLIRMRDSEGGILSPASFLPAAEEYGFIADIDRWVIDRSAEIAASGLAVELNISATSITDPTLVKHIAEAIERTGADPTTMVFEITETALVGDLKLGSAFVSALHALGCKVALDDFGTGYGGFTYLKQLPIDYLKIDIEFVRDLAHSGASRKVVEAIVNLARGFELQTVAEGVEDEQTLVLLRELGVDYAQGFHIGRPGELELPGQAAAS